MKEIFNSMIVNKSSAVPYYYQIKEFVENEIKNGNLLPGDSLPSEDEIAKSIGVSRPTLRQAFRELEIDGYLDRQRAKGTFITKPQIYGNYLNKLESFFHEMVGQGKKPITKVLKMAPVKNEGTIKEILNCEESIYIERVRYADDTPVVYLESYIPYNLFSDILEKNLETESMYDMMTELQQPVSRVVRTIQAQSATNTESKYLEIPNKSPILYITTNGYSEEKIPLEYSIARYDGNNNKFSIELNR